METKFKFLTHQVCISSLYSLKLSANSNSVSPSLEQGDGAFAAEALRLHNSLRSRHGAPDLVLDPSLTKFAQRWADHLASTGKFHHCPDNKYGENLYAQWAASTKSVVSLQFKKAVIIHSNFIEKLAPQVLRTSSYKVDCSAICPKRSSQSQKSSHSLSFGSS